MRYADNFCTYKEGLRDGEHVYIYTGPYEDGNGTRSVVVPSEGLYRYRQGALIQKAFPEMSSDDREFLMTGISPEKWDRLFKDQED